VFSLSGLSARAAAGCGKKRADRVIEIIISSYDKISKIYAAKKRYELQKKFRFSRFFRKNLLRIVLKTGHCFLDSGQNKEGGVRVTKI